MELKFGIVFIYLYRATPFNRTAYGIEITKQNCVV